jgi:hypothetical protein
MLKRNQAGEQIDRILRAWKALRLGSEWVSRWHVWALCCIFLGPGGKGL